MEEQSPDSDVAWIGVGVSGVGGGRLEQAAEQLRVRRRRLPVGRRSCADGRGRLQRLRHSRIRPSPAGGPSPAAWDRLGRGREVVEICDGGGGPRVLKVDTCQQDVSIHVNDTKHKQGKVKNNQLIFPFLFSSNLIN